MIKAENSPKFPQRNLKISQENPFKNLKIYRTGREFSKKFLMGRGYFDYIP